MDGADLMIRYNKYWEAWHESERVFYKLLIPTEKEILQKDLANRLDRANELKEQGNILYRKQDYQMAIQKYIESIEFIPRNLFSSYKTDEYIKLKLIIITNLSMCFLKVKNYEAAVLQCQEGLKVFPYNIKLRYILGCSLGEKEDYEEAIEVLKAAKEIEPLNRDVIEKLKFFQGKHKEYKEKMKAMFGGKLQAVKKEVVSEVIGEERNLEVVVEPQGENKSKSKWPYMIIGASLLALAGILYKKSR